MTKEQLLQKVSEIDIFRHYVPGFSPNRKRNYKSPFSEKDDNPSLSIYRDGSAWKFKSLNTGHQGDCFQFVADLKNIDCKKDFKKIVEIIAAEIGTPPISTPPGDGGGENKSKNVKISYEPAYTKAFLDYFSQFKISAETLDLLHVSQVKYHEFYSANGKLCKFDYRKDKKIAVCYTAQKNERTTACRGSFVFFIHPDYLFSFIELIKNKASNNYGFFVLQKHQSNSAFINFHFEIFLAISNWLNALNPI